MTAVETCSRHRMRWPGGRTQSRNHTSHVCYSVGLRRVSVIRAAAAMVLFLGCRRPPTVMTPGGAAKVTETAKGKGSIEMAVAGQKVKGDYGVRKIPADFPKDMPIYSAYKPGFP